MNPVSRVSIGVVLHEISRFKDKDGRYPVKLQVTFQRVQRQYSIPRLRFTPEEYGVIIDSISKSEQRRLGLNRLYTTDEKKYFKSILIKIQDRAEEIIKGMEDFDFEIFKVAFKGQGGKTRQKKLADYFENKARELDATGKVGTATGYRSTLISLIKFQCRLVTENDFFIKNMQ